MTSINRKPVSLLGYNFIQPAFIPKGKDEYYLRNIQNRNGIRYRKLSAYEIEVLVRNRNTSDNWNKVLVSDAFNPELVKNCKFFGLIRIGKLEPYYLEYHDVKMPVGLYDSTIISCDFGDNVVISNVNYLSHYIIGNEVMVVNINEMSTTDHAKFGNGIIKEEEPEAVRIWLEVCNENAGRKILPFNGMLPGDAWLWSRYRDHQVLMDKLVSFTEKKFDRRRGYYGKIGDRTVIKNVRIIKDVWIGTDAYIKGANKIKNVTINSSPAAKSQVGEGCELVNGIIGFGCRVFYGVKAVRFFLSSNSQLKYGARLINSYLGDNSTISCCEVLNSLIFPAHEQHHNNSFLCAALVMGQSNMAAGATIGSNHNSRAADGEIIAGRGFWPGLCVSLKHNSRFASFTIIAKGDFPAELDVPFPFSLVSNDVSRDRVTIMPAYWFLHNMYALARNSQKYIDRDRRIEKNQQIEYEFLAPDSINEIFEALRLIKKYSPAQKGAQQETPSETDITAEGIENSKRRVVLLKAEQAAKIYRELVIYYGGTQLIRHMEKHKISSWEKLVATLPSKSRRSGWINMGGQLLPEASINTLIAGIQKGTINSWDAIHEFYQKNAALYNEQCFQHAFAALLELLEIKKSGFTQKLLIEVLQQTIDTREWMTKEIYESRAKDYRSPFRQMVYRDEAEMEAVTGRLEDNGFIKTEKTAFLAFKKNVTGLIRKIKR
ncbi:MAG: DUF4954 family protein [Terrimonas sp.]|nr:DUF4954 family protein [Terrimonas sp.]